MIKDVLKMFHDKKTMNKEIRVVKSGKNIKFWDVIKNIIPMISNVVIQLVPIWILIILSMCLDIQFRINSFLENILVYNIVAGGGFLIASGEKTNGEKGQHIRLLSVLIVILASVSYAGLLLTVDSIGAAGVLLQDEHYITATVIVTQFTMLVQHIGLTDKEQTNVSA